MADDEQATAAEASQMPASVTLCHPENGDLVLILNNKSRITVFTFILSHSSPVFRTMLGPIYYVIQSEWQR